EAPMRHLYKLDLSGPWCNPYYRDVGRQPVDEVGATAWAESPNAETIHELRLSGTRLKDTGLRALARSTRLRSLEYLDISNNTFSQDGMAALEQSSLWNSLRELSFSNCRLDDNAIKSLTR